MFGSTMIDPFENGIRQVHSNVDELHQKSHLEPTFNFFPLLDIMDLRHQSSAMCIIMLGEKRIPHASAKTWRRTFRQKKYAETSQAKNICRNVSCDMWGISDVCTLALTVAKTSSHYDRFAISVLARSLLLFDLA